MRWFGGSITQAEFAPVPRDARLLTSHPHLWLVGEWPEPQMRMVTAVGVTVLVIGPCSADDTDLVRLLDGIPDSAMTAWAGAYTIVRATRDRRVTIMTDPSAACPIYSTWTDNDTLIWASSSRALASLAGGQVDEPWLSSNLLDPTRPCYGRSAWEDVAMLPPGHRFTAEAGRPSTLRSAWRPTRLSLDEAVTRTRQTLDEAVACRVQASAPAADLSGGLDSSMLAVLAARYRPVTAITVHPAGIDAGGDLDYARITAAQTPNLRHELLPLGEPHLPYTGMHDLPPTDEPAPSTPTWVRLATELRLLANAGITIHLTGDGGDTLFGPPPVHLIELARTGRWLQLAAQTQQWARLRRSSPWPLLAGAIRGDSTRLRAVGPPVGLTSKAAALAATLPTPSATPALGWADHALVTDVRQVARTAHTEAQLADAFGITMHNPYLDARLLDTVLAIPPWLRSSATQYKPLLRRAGIGLLPEPVRLRATKGVFAGDHHRGVRANLSALHPLADGHLADRGLVDPRWLSDQLDRAAVGLDVRWSQLTTVIATEVWLRTIATTPPVCWTCER